MAPLNRYHIIQQLLMFHFTICNSQWISPSNQVLPRSSDSMAVGLYNHSIYLLGGINGFQLVEYDILNDNFIDHGENKFSPTDLMGSSDFYTQIDTIIYIIQRDGNTLVSYNMETDEFNDNLYTISSTVGAYGCLASRVGYLYVVGGYDYGADTNLNTVQVMDLNTNSWLINVPSMKEQRIGHTCIVHANILYAISGYTWNSKNNLNTYTTTIEQINTDNIIQNAWSYITGELSQGLAYIRSVIYRNDIYVIGGAYGKDGSWTLVDTVYLIDTITGFVSVSNDHLPQSISSVASIIVNNILYAFGGYIGSGVDTWMMYELPQTTTSTTAVLTTTTSTTDVLTTTNPIISIASNTATLTTLAVISSDPSTTASEATITSDSSTAVLIQTTESSIYTSNSPITTTVATTTFEHISTISTTLETAVSDTVSKTVVLQTSTITTQRLSEINDDFEDGDNIVYIVIIGIAIFVGCVPTLCIFVFSKIQKSRKIIIESQLAKAECLEAPQIQLQRAVSLSVEPVIVNNEIHEASVHESSDNIEHDSICDEREGPQVTTDIRNEANDEGEASVGESPEPEGGHITTHAFATAYIC